MNPTSTTATAPKAVTRTTEATPRTLDDLAALDVAALEALYRAGTVPSSLHALDGSPTCRMLAIRGLDRGAPASAIRNLAGASFFPWAGKSFEASGDRAGTGINRVRLGGGRRWFPFHTRVEPSAIDGAPCILLDYDLAANPKPIRLIRDELREVAPDLYLGPAMLDTGPAPPRLILFFACHAEPHN